MTDVGDELIKLLFLNVVHGNSLCISLCTNFERLIQREIFQ